MRDFRDAKAMAHTLRAALAAKDIKITISQSLELIAETFGVADWNTLSAAIRADAAAPRNNATPPPVPLPIAASAPGLRFSVGLEATLHRALAHANQRKHQYATLEHLLLALTDDGDASAVMKACNVDVGVLRTGLVHYLETKFENLVADGGGDAKPTAAFQREAGLADELLDLLGLALRTSADGLVRHLLPLLEAVSAGAAGVLVDGHRPHGA